MKWIDGNTFFGSWPHRKLDVPAEELVRLLKEAGTSKALTLCLAAPKLNAVEGNDLTRLACVQHRELIPFAAVDPRKYTSEHPVKHIRDLGCAAIRLTNSMNGFPLDISPVEEIMTECAEQDLTVFVDVTDWGVATVCERLTRKTGCRIALCAVRYAILAETIVSMKRSKRLYLGISKLNTPDAIRAAADVVGADRIFHESGAPFNYAANARAVAEHNHLTDEELDWISSKTVLSLVSEEYRS